MRKDFNLIKKYYNFLIYSFSLFLLQCSNTVKIIITILVQNKKGSMELKYTYNVIKKDLT